MDRIDSMQFKIAELTGAGDMLLKREILVGGNVQVADSRSSIQLDRERDRKAFLVLRSDVNHLFCLFRIRLKFTVVYPCMNIQYVPL